MRVCFVPVVFIFFALCSASDLTEEERLGNLVKSLQQENSRQAAIIQEYEASTSRRLAAKKPKTACFDYKYVGGCVGSSPAWCNNVKAMKSVGGHTVRRNIVGFSGGYCGLSFDNKNWKNKDEKTTFGSELCAKIAGCTHFGINDDAKNKPGQLVTKTYGFFEFSNGGSTCDKKKHDNKHYKTYAMKKCPPPPKKPDPPPAKPKPSPPIKTDDYQGLRVKNDKSIVSLGKKSDVVLVRTGASKAALYGSLSLVDNLVAEKGITAKGSVTTFSTLNAMGGVRFGMNAGTCDKSRAGTIRYNTQKDQMEFCSGKTAAWKSFSAAKPKLDGTSASRAANSCRSIKAEFKFSKDGQYWVKPDRWDGAPFRVYCDMSTGPGGWTLVSQGFGGPMPQKNWRSNNPYDEAACEKLQSWKSNQGKICKFQAKKINALVSNDKTGRYRSFVPYPHSNPKNRYTYSLGTCVYNYNKALNFNKNTNMNNNPCIWSSAKFDMSSPQAQPHRGTQGFEHYAYGGQKGRGFALHYGSDSVRWWLVDGHHHGDTRANKLNFVLWVY